MYRLGRVHAGKPNGNAIPPLKLNDEGVTVHDARNLGGADVGCGRPDGAVEWNVVLPSRGFATCRRTRLAVDDAVDLILCDP